MQNKPTTKSQKERLRTPSSVLEAQALPFSPTDDGINKWLQNLPILNVTVIGEHLHIAASAILTNELSDKTRFTLIEKIIPNLYVLFDECIKEVLDAKFPLQDKLNYLTEKLLSVLNEFINVYISIIKSESFDAKKSNKEQPIFNESQQAAVIRRAINLLGLMQLFSSLTYRPCAINNWGEINALLCLAQSDELENIETGINIENAHDASSVINEFIKISYIHLALLNRFRQRDILKIHETINSQAHTVSLTKEKPEHASFFINPYKDLELTNINAYQKHEENILFFENELLTQHFTSLALDKSANKIMLNSAVIQKILPCWQKPHKRQFARTGDSKEIIIYPGFKNIINKLSPNDTPSISLGKMPTSQKRNTFGLSDVEIIPIENNTLHQGYLRSEKDIGRVIKETDANTVKSVDIWSCQKKPKHSEDTGHVDATQQDSSATGFMFKVSKENKPYLQAADLIGINTVEEDSLELAIIRRLENLENDGISLGVELIAPIIKLGVICNTDKSIRSREVLFLPGIERLNQPDAIISISPLENTRINLELKIENRFDTYTISKLVETNAVFTRYTLQKTTKEG
jgi:hypothetical protein